MAIETGVVILFNLRKHGFAVHRSPSGNIQVAPPGRLPEYLKDAIRQNKDAILAALEGETATGVGKVERNARMNLVLLAKWKTPWGIATETEGEWTYVCLLRRKGPGWTIRIPTDKFDPFLFAEALARDDLRARVNKPDGGFTLSAGESPPKIPKISEDSLPFKDGYLR